ncbi:MAG TPA: hypothetical protein VFU92_03775, partial [Usitatibacter sp.]|nr:hypothetical protein [Usitatibacter sp.]
MRTVIHPRLSAFICGLFVGLTFAQAPAVDDDAFRYLEDPADARTAAFYREQDVAARAKLDAIPGRAEMLTRIRALREASSTVSSIAL